jgi:hypothetical protein
MGTVEMFCICWDDPSLNAGLTPGMRLDEVMARARLRPRKPGRRTRFDHRRGGADISEGRPRIEALDGAERGHPIPSADRGCERLVSVSRPRR